MRQDAISFRRNGEVSHGQCKAGSRIDVVAAFGPVLLKRRFKALSISWGEESEGALRVRKSSVFCVENHVGTADNDG